MNIRKIGVVLLALLLAAMANTPLAAASDRQMYAVDWSKVATTGRGKGSPDDHHSRKGQCSGNLRKRQYYPRDLVSYTRSGQLISRPVQ
jgi:hypothetical protein